MKELKEQAFYEKVIWASTLVAPDFLQNSDLFLN